MELEDIPSNVLSAMKARDREGWLALFADDATVENPVGFSEWNPEGKGQVGKKAIATFYDMFANYQESFDFTIHHQEVCGDEIAVFLTSHVIMKDGSQSTTKAINIYKRCADGRIQSLRSFWNV